MRGESAACFRLHCWGGWVRALRELLMLLWHSSHIVFYGQPRLGITQTLASLQWGGVCGNRFFVSIGNDP